MMHFDRLRLLNASDADVDEVFYQGFSEENGVDATTGVIQVLPIGYLVAKGSFIDHQTGYVTIRTLRIARLSAIQAGVRRDLFDWDIVSTEPIAEAHVLLSTDPDEKTQYLATAFLFRWDGTVVVEGPVGF